MIPKPISQIDQTDVQRLIDSEVREGQTIEYKRDLNVGTRDDKKEFLADVSSFANSAGGDLVFGMCEQGGVPTEIIGIDLPNLDKDIQGLENIIRDGLEPRLQPNVEIQPIMLDEGRRVLIIRIRRSWVAPHRISFGKDYRFYARNSVGKYPLDVYELREAFLLSENVAERIRDFRIERIAQITSNETCIPLTDGIKLILHIVPLSAFIRVANVNIPIPPSEAFAPLARSSGYGFRVNLDGVAYAAPVVNGSLTYAYTQLYRNGIVEAVSVYPPVQNKRVLPSETYEREVSEGLRVYLPSLQRLGIEPPMYIFVALVGVAHSILDVSQHVPLRHGSSVIDRNELILPEVVVENFDEDLERITKPIFDLVWNAYGYPR